MGTPFRSLLPAWLVRRLGAQGITHATPIQGKALPGLLAGRDAVVTSETGSGKTLVAALPLLVRAGKAKARPHSVVLAPTAELCNQLARVVEELGGDKVDVWAGRGARRATDRPSVVVGTPHSVHKRLASSPHVSADGVGYVACDEADLLLSKSFSSDVDRLLSAVTPVHAGRSQSHHSAQFVFCAATLTDAPHHRAVAAWLDKNCRYAEHISSKSLHRLSRQVTASIVQLDLDVIEKLTAGKQGGDFEDVLWDARCLAVTRVIHSACAAAEGGRARVLIFANHTDTVEALSAALELSCPSLVVRPLHKLLPTPERQATLEAFRDGAVDVVVATDIVARGVDTTFVTHVVEAELAPDIPIHLHRAGRTARAGRPGTWVAIATSEEAPIVRQVLDLTQPRHGGLAAPIPNGLTQKRNARRKTKRIQRQARP